MRTATEVQTTQVYNIVIKATPEAVFEAITRPEFTERYFYGAGAPKTAAAVSGGWMTVHSGLKTLLETGEPRA
jgi:uncharacterized protein YndB with AHSA1/START domain